MDAAVTPPLRILVARAEGISAAAAQSRLHAFLNKYEDRRRLASNGGDSTISAQLEKLTDALNEEADARRKHASQK